MLLLHQNKPVLKQVTPYDASPDSKKKQVSNMFNNIAGYYDFLNHFLSLGIDIQWRKKMARELTDKAYPTIIDVATGTADVALTLSQYVKTERIIGVDIAHEMLEIGRKKINKAEKTSLISLELGDSENLRFEDNYADAITVAFGVRNFENLNQGLKEMYRVLKPGGKLVILEFSKPQIFPFKQLYNAYFRYILPSIGKITSKDPKAYRYLYESVQAFPGNREFIKVLTENGYKNPVYKALTLGICTIYVAYK
jgi:demethylmenaquinone methyltransferase / 2-methoxy-6-polyprenyl-1,4-benzoquinol methylase